MTKSQSTIEHVVAQAVEALADACNATIEVPRLDTTMSYLQQEL